MTKTFPQRMNHQNDEGIASFAEAFGPLAHHLFPDGCPQDDLREEWPQRLDRTPVSSGQTKASISGSLPRFAHQHGLTSKQLSCVALAACSTLALKETKSVGEGSPLVDGTSHYFRSIVVQCLLPNHGAAEAAVVEPFVVEMLLTVPCDMQGRAVALRFLTMAVRSGLLVGPARRVLSSFYYGVVLWWMQDVDLCADAMRLLHAVTRRKHVRLDRAQRLSEWYQESLQKTKALQKRVGPLWLMLQLYARYDPQGCGRFFPTNRKVGTSISRLFQIPDSSWQQDFGGKHRVHQNQFSMESDKKGEDMQLSEQPQTMSSKLNWLSDAFDGVHSFSWGLVEGRQRRVLRASDLLTDDDLCQIILLSARNPNDVAETELARLRACLPYMLHEEWYSVRPGLETRQVHDDDASDGSLSEGDVDGVGASAAPWGDARIKVLQALASFVVRSDTLLPEAEMFLLEDVLPQWDGSDRTALLLCYELLPYIQPCTMADLESKVLRHVENLLRYGSARLQSALISGFFTLLLRRWAILDWTSSMNATTDPPRTKKRKKHAPTTPASLHKIKSDTLRALIAWVEMELQKAFVVEDGPEVLRVATLDFMDAALDAAQSCGFLITPSHVLVYNLLLSKTALSIDRLCAWLLRFKQAFQHFKSLEGTDRAIPREELTERISVFNCFVWDVCSVLWRQSALPSDFNESARSRSILFTQLTPRTLGYLQRRQDMATKALSITHGAAFAEHAQEFLVSSSSSLEKKDRDEIRGALKVRYLDFLHQQEGFQGLFSFLTTFVGSLAEREQRRQERRRQRRNNKAAASSTSLPRKRS